MKKEKEEKAKGEEKEEKEYERAIQVGTWHGIEPRCVARWTPIASLPPAVTLAIF